MTDISKVSDTSVTNRVGRLTQSPVDDVVRIAAVGFIAALAVCGLYFGRPLLVPLALAMLLAFALAPIAVYLKRLRLPHGLAVGLTALIALLSVACVAAFIAIQIAQLAVELPRYQTNLTNKIQSIRGSTASNSVVKGASSLVNNLNSALVANPTQPLGQASQTRARTAKPTPRLLPVAVNEIAPASSFQTIEDTIDSFLEPLGAIAIVSILVVFILLRKEDLRDRFISLASVNDLHRTAAAIDDGAQRLSRYLLLQSMVNITFGFTITLGLWLLGIPNPALWGLVAALFRFVPYVGIPAAAALPLALALAIDPGWEMALATAALFFGLEAIVGQAVEPWLYGRHMGLSPIAVVVAAGVWTWLWGPVGLLLSTPLTMCLVVMGRHVERLRFLNVLLGDQPPLSNEEGFYLRMLAGNADEAADQAEQFLKQATLAQYLDDVSMKGLILAQADLERGVLDDQKCGAIRSTVTTFTENLANRQATKNAATAQSDPSVSKGTDPAAVVLCVPALSELDQAVSILLALLLNEEGIRAVVAPGPQFTLEAALHDRVAVVCVSFLSSEKIRSGRFLVRRMRSSYPEAQFVAGQWCPVAASVSQDERMANSGCDHVVESLTAMIEEIRTLVSAGARQA